MGSIASPKRQEIKFVFLDRDGVINRKPPEGETVWRWEDFEILPGVEAAIARLNAAGCTVIVVTNQRAIALGQFSEGDLQALHARLREHLASHHATIDAIYFCPHDRGQCTCRKPGRGLFDQAFNDFPGAYPGNSIMIGDSISDIEAGIRLGMTTVFIQGERDRQKAGAADAAAISTRVSTSLFAAVSELLGEP
jgi:D-glycero-D-manno-heptose 1,7-bisphosphate phosphatase